MKRLVVAALLGWLAWLAPSAQAQIIGRPGVGYPYGGYGYGYPYGGYGGGPFGPGTLPGMAGIGASPYNVVPTIITPNATQYGGMSLGTPMETGHPTRFASYSQYFSNQGGGYVTPGDTTPVARTGAATTLGAAGTRSTTPPARTGTATTPPKTP